MAVKDRDRLTVYVDKAMLERFKIDAEAMYRSMSDHINAVLAEYYARQNGRVASRNGENQSEDNQ